jgi:hypothetical protein
MWPTEKRLVMLEEKTLSGVSLLMVVAGVLFQAREEREGGRESHKCP